MQATRRAVTVFGGCQIKHLSTRHTTCPGGPRQGGNHRAQVHTDIGLCRHFKRCGDQCIAGQDGHVFAVHLVQTRHATPKIVVVHSREVIMNQRGDVQQFHCAGEGKGGVEVTAAALAGGQQQDRP